MKREETKTIAIVSIFAIAMAFLESSVVVYLRKLYYPLGFGFPIKGVIDPSILSIEWCREIATIVMLLCVAFMVGKKFNERLAYFMYSFAIWDIFYYVWLEVMLNWPASKFTWDLLFLIPWPWASPVLAPLICSLTLILFAYFLISNKEKKINKNEWILLFLGSLIILYTFLVDYAKIIFSNGFAKSFFTLTENKAFQAVISAYVPSSFNWLVFIIGEVIILCAIIMFSRRK